jgi:hypothetical protein
MHAARIEALHALRAENGTRQTLLFQKAPIRT